MSNTPKEAAKHAAHVAAVEVGLHSPSAAEKVIKSLPLKTYPENPILLQPQPVRWGAARLLGRLGRVLGFSVKRVPVVGTLIDIFTPSNTIVSDAEEKRMLRGARKKNQVAPSVEQGKQYSDGTVLWPKSREWSFPPTTITLSKPAKPQHVQNLAIEGGSSASHTIRKGDRVWNLAGDYGYKDKAQFTKEVEELNPGINFRKLMPGQKINVPIKNASLFPYATSKALSKPQGSSSYPSTLQLLSKELLKGPINAAYKPDPRTQNWLNNLSKTYKVPQVKPPQPRPPNTLQMLSKELAKGPINSAYKTSPSSQSWLKDLSKTYKAPSAPSTRSLTQPSTLQILSRELSKGPINTTYKPTPSTQMWLNDLAKTYKVPPFNPSQPQPPVGSLRWMAKGLGPR